MGKRRKGRRGKQGRGAGGRRGPSGPKPAVMEPPRARLERVDPFRYRVRKDGPMRVEGLIFADEKLIELVRRDRGTAQRPCMAKGSLRIHPF